MTRRPTRRHLRAGARHSSRARLRPTRRARAAAARRTGLRSAGFRPAAEAPAPAERSTTALLATVAAQASLITAVMFYLGAVYLTAFYHYFRLDLFALGIGFPELAVQALNLVRRPLLMAVTVTAYAVLRPGLVTGLPWPAPVARLLRRTGARARHADLLLMPAGLATLALWRWTHSYGWAAALALALGLARAHRRTTGGPDGRTSRAPGRTAATSVTGLLVMWAVTLAANDLGVAEADLTGRDVVRRTAVVLLTTERLSLAGPGIHVEDLGKGAHFRYRYTGLRRLIERDGRYYLLPLGWTPATGTTYVIDIGDDIRVELMPGAR
ncbi:hypothetical protein [Streptomyces sp. NPDC051132]|uniref:hypothetical protein n=1 Tax=unclassified Streptomyces TaxID=2593676 RepID=UPI0034471B3E